MLNNEEDDRYFRGTFASYKKLPFQDRRWQGAIRIARENRDFRIKGPRGGDDDIALHDMFEEAYIVAEKNHPRHGNIRIPDNVRLAVQYTADMGERLLFLIEQECEEVRAWGNKCLTVC